MKKLVFALCVGCVLFSCKTRKVAVTPQKNTTTTRNFKNDTEKYIYTYSEIAQDEMKRYNIPASITIAQGILESGSGNGRLSVKANNHFGIKCHDWTGARIYHDDDKKGECFRKYRDAKYSFRDHSLFLKERKRYAKLFNLKITDYKGWARELRAAGYATDRKYPDKLINIIETYKLYELDKGVLGKEYVASKPSKTSSKIYKVVKGDTLYSISKRYNLTVQQLQKLNDLSNASISIGQELRVK